MKTYLFLLVGFFATAALAQNNQMLKQLQNMTPEQQKAFAEQMQKAMSAQGNDMMACYQKIDQAEMQKLQSETEAKQAEIKAMCAAGNRQAAEKEAMRFGMAMQNRPVVKQLQACGKDLKQSMPIMALSNPSRSGERKHICDGY